MKCEKENWNHFFFPSKKEKKKKKEKRKKKKRKEKNLDWVTLKNAWDEAFATICFKSKGNIPAVFVANVLIFTSGLNGIPCSNEDKISKRLVSSGVFEKKKMLLEKGK